jgi:hypothetical protein
MKNWDLESSTCELLKDYSTISLQISRTTNYFKHEIWSPDREFKTGTVSLYRSILLKYACMCFVRARSHTRHNSASCYGSGEFIVNKLNICGILLHGVPLAVENIVFFNTSFLHQVEIRLRRRISLYECTPWQTRRFKSDNCLTIFLRTEGNAL